MGKILNELHCGFPSCDRVFFRTSSHQVYCSKECAKNAIREKKKIRRRVKHGNLTTFDFVKGIEASDPIPENGYAIWFKFPDGNSFNWCSSNRKYIFSVLDSINNGLFGLIIDVKLYIIKNFTLNEMEIAA